MSRFPKGKGLQGQLVSRAALDAGRASEPLRWSQRGGALGWGRGCRRLLPSSFLSPACLAPFSLSLSLSLSRCPSTSLPFLFFYVLSLPLPLCLSVSPSPPVPLSPSLNGFPCVPVPPAACFSACFSASLHLCLLPLPLPCRLPSALTSVCPSLQVQAVGGQLLRNVRRPGHLRRQGRPQQGRPRLHHRGEGGGGGPPGSVQRKEPNAVSRMISCVVTPGGQLPEASRPPPHPHSQPHLRPCAQAF